MAKGKYQEWKTPEGCGKLEAWARDGLTDEQLARMMGITRKTLYEWLKAHSDICDAIRRGRGGAREQIENALYQMSQDRMKPIKRNMKLRVREYDKKTGKCIRDEEIIKEVEDEVFLKGDVEAAKFYLANRFKDRWALNPEPEMPAEREGASVVIVDV